jgi:hypothetical protein
MDIRLTPLFWPKYFVQPGVLAILIVLSAPLHSTQRALCSQRALHAPTACVLGTAEEGVPGSREERGAGFRSCYGSWSWDPQTMEHNVEAHGKTWAEHVTSMRDGTTWGDEGCIQAWRKHMQRWCLPMAYNAHHILGTINMQPYAGNAKRIYMRHALSSQWLGAVLLHRVGRKKQCNCY